MANVPRLLVVDDEAVICQACRRILSRQGYEIDHCTEAREGLRRAVRESYAAILLDIKMPELDGIAFLEALRKERPDVPVMMMTGYPSIPNAAAAVRLGASDYLTKPFTPEQITQSVRRMLGRFASDNGLSAAAAESCDLLAEGCLFWEESWLRPEVDGSALVGAVLKPSQARDLQGICLPTMGEAVYQGLPLAGVVLADGTRMTVPSPISGVVVALNETLAEDPSALLGEPCGEGWLACLCTTRLDDEIGRCAARHAILVNSDEESADDQTTQLKALGCRVHVVRDVDEMIAAAEERQCPVMLLDATSLGADGPAVAHRAGAVSPGTKVVVVAQDASQGEAEYRRAGIFYYAVRPFDDGEIVEILDAVFRPGVQARSSAARRKDHAEPLHAIRVINRNGHKVQLLAGPGLLRRDGGLGLMIRDRLAERAFPIVTTPGDAEVSAAAVLAAAGDCDRVMVLQAADAGRLPGSLIRDTRAEYIVGSRENAGRVTTLVVQPVPLAEGLVGLEERTLAALADHIVQEMASY